ncbi:solute carrier 26 family protein [Leptolyngbyaceae cyanobacterium CCMR0082]|uniref:Solute carrier 26 family protein n=1 Tax=Adonisia turfae CCMR0082 TaxID=2304604 RepID=A0A6M0S5B5_9CYAN|nr:solute carrier family 26 protein [Adonisia turfae]MDV3347089.1 solute carrier family 26 protein [Leptothoe sp. LEGE 181152]NEZ63585.1 solute carrier 26 family protein [Adonisia turfae CCMR0082]
MEMPLGLKQLLSYQSAWLRGDILAGLTVAAYLIPQCMAYGELAGVQPVAGLWAILPAMVIYTLLGSSPQLSVGPESTTAVMTAVAIAPLATPGGSDYAILAALLALLVGGIYILGYLTRLGFLADLLSKPILIGYMAGVAVIMMAGQLSKVSGVPTDADTVLGEIQAFVTHLSQYHGPTLILSLAVLVFLFVVQARWPNAPGPLLAVLLATVAVNVLRLDQLGVAVVGNIPAGLPQLNIPNLSMNEVTPLMAAAIGIAVVGYSDNVLTARAFATRNGYKIDANQELLALGAVNIGAGLMQGFPISSSGSRTVLGNALGNKTQLFSLVAMVTVVGVLLFMRPVLSLFPQAALGALVIYAATRLIEMSEFVRLLRFRSTEFALAVITTLGVLATDLLVGIAIAISLSVVDLFARVARPHDAVLGQVLGLAGWHDIDDWDDATTIPGLVIYRYDAPICFANVENFKRRAMAAIEAEQERVEWFVLNTEAIAEIDITAADMLVELHQELCNQGIVFALARVKQDLYSQLKRSGLRDLIGNERIYPTLKTAIRGFEDRYRFK